jgi:hypothetical protein
MTSAGHSRHVAVVRSEVPAWQRARSVIGISLGYQARQRPWAPEAARNQLLDIGQYSQRDMSDARRPAFYFRGVGGNSQRFCREHP